jgi:phosphomevalonate kinase
MLDAMRATADRFVSELAAGRATGAVAAAGRYGRHMGELGKAAGVSIVTEAFAEAGALARELGGEVKPSGAGGGDVGLAFFATPEAASLFARACRPRYQVLDLQLSPGGVRRRSSDEPEVEPAGPFHHG